MLISLDCTNTLISWGLLFAGLVKLTKQDLRDACDIFDIDSTLEKKDELLIALLSHLDATYHLGISPWPSATQPGLDLEAQGADLTTWPHVVWRAAATPLIYLTREMP